MELNQKQRLLMAKTTLKMRDINKDAADKVVEFWLADVGHVSALRQSEIKRLKKIIYELLQNGLFKE